MPSGRPRINHEKMKSQSWAVNYKKTILHRRSGGSTEISMAVLTSSSVTILNK